MRLVSAHDRGVLRTRVLACGCWDGCPTRFVAATVKGRDRLWLVTGMAPAAEVGELVSWLLEDVELNESRPSEVVETGVAAVGLSWGRLMTGGQPVAVAQMRAFDALPGWVCRRPVREVWAVRGLVFGDDLTRVPRALEALDAAADVGGRPVVGWVGGVSRG